MERETVGSEGSIDYQCSSSSALSKLGAVIRWIAVLPGAIAAWAISLFPIHWATLLIKAWPTNEDSIGLEDIPARQLEALGVGLFGSMAFVYFGAWLAPRYRAPTAGALVMLWMLVVGTVAGFFIAGFGNDQIEVEAWGWLQVAAVVALNAAGAIVAFLQYWDRD